MALGALLLHRHPAGERRPDGGRGLVHRRDGRSPAPPACLINYFLPAALIRLFAILRTGGRYLERLVTHEATFRLLSELRVWFYAQLEPLAPARLEHYRGSDLLERIQADIDTLHHAYLRVLVPVAGRQSPASLVVAIVLACTDAGWRCSPWSRCCSSPASRCRSHAPSGRAPGAGAVEARAALRAAVVDGVQGMAELRVYGAAQRQARRIDT